jgi:hypothetical protein
VGRVGKRVQHWRMHCLHSIGGCRKSREGRGCTEGGVGEGGQGTEVDIKPYCLAMPGV